MGVMIGCDEKVSRTYRIQINDTIENADEFADVIELLYQATDEDVFVFLLNSGGGRLDAATALINTMAITQAHTVGVIKDDASSASALIFFACDEHEVFATSSMTLHECIYGIDDQGSKVRSAADHINKKYMVLFDMVAGGFLSDSEKAEMYKGVNFSFIGEEIADRMQKVYELRMGDDEQEEPQKPLMS
jgi:ATP-dependent protease ClpP protease subunit